MTERWTTTQVADYLGIQPGTWRDYVSAGRAPGPLGERDPETGAKLYDADAVRAWKVDRPGRGARTDLGARGASVGQTGDNKRAQVTTDTGRETVSDQHR